MSVTLTGTGGLFTRLGRVGRLLYAAAVDQAEKPALYTSLFAQWASTHIDLIAPLEELEDGAVRAVTPPAGTLFALARNTLLKQVGDDVPSAGTAVDAALAELIRQMKASGDSVKACTVGATATALTGPANTGNGAVVLVTKRGDGLVNELMVPETARLVCSSDSYTGGQTAAREPFRYAGPARTTSTPWDYDFVTGSGAATALRTVDPSQDASGSTSGLQVLTNGTMETWAGSPLAATGWTIAGGAWATDIVRDTTSHAGTYAAKFIASSTPSIYTQFGTDTVTTLTPLASYAVNLWVRRLSSAITTGTLVVELVDGTGTVIADDAGNNNTFSVTLSTLTTTYAAKSGSFRLPSVPPTTVRLRLRVSVAADNAFLVDDVAMATVTPAYPGGPGIAVFAGSTPWKQNDGFDIAVTNNFGGATFPVGTFQWLVRTLFGQTAALLPSSGSPTIADSLITS